MARGLPPNVVPCWPAVSSPETAGPTHTSAPIGTPPPSPFARVKASGTTGSAAPVTAGFWKPNHVPVRPTPDCTSSRIIRAPASRVAARTSAR